MPSVPVFVHDDVLMWFNKNFDTLESQAFFEILNQQIKYVVLQNLNAKAKLRLGDILKVISHGMELVKNEDKTEIINILQLLYTIEYYGQIFLHDSVFASFAQRVIEVLKKRDMVANRFDLFYSLSYLSSMEYLNRETPTSRAIFRRHANGNYAAWKWLQNSIELVFKDDDLVDMRQMTAVAAVRAYKWNAVDFSPDDVDRFLETAVEPFQFHPTDIFDLPKHALSQKAVNRLLHLITAIRSAGVSDLPRLGKLSVRLDDVFWNKFFQLVEKEAPKLGSRVSLLYSLNYLKKIMPPLAPDELPFVCEPIDSERWKWLFNIQNKFIKK